MADYPPIIIDNGSGYSFLDQLFRCSLVCSYTKMGYAGNAEPDYIIPSVIGTAQAKGVAATRKGVEVRCCLFSVVLMLYEQDLDFYIGDEAQSRSKTYDVSCPIKHAQINNWDHMERIWEQSIYQYLRVDPENHNFLLVRYLCRGVFALLICYFCICRLKLR